MKIKPTFNIQHSTSNSEGIRAGNARPFEVGYWKLNVEGSPSSCHPSRVTRHSQKGVALIITLILLAVVTFMALTFLAVSRRERGAVTTTTDTASARLAADAALAGAEAQIVANVLATTNPYNFGLLVSTNYLPLTTGNPLDDLANLFISPRTPVFVTTSNGTDFRFYLDLNRNGRDDTNGWVTNVDISGVVIKDGSGNPTANFEVGDPEWIGVLQHPDQSYGPNNPFVARYAFIAMPIGNALDLNAIYNQAASKEVNLASGGVDGFMRNQGVGSWEINLAAFLADLNTNEWLPTVPPANLYYAYYEPGNGANKGHAFEDALSLLSYRYGYNYNSLAPVGGTTPNGLFTTAITFPPFKNNIDAYSDGPLMTNSFGINESGQDVTLPWSGADNTNQFFDLQELFNTGETAMGVAPVQIAAGNDFTGRLLDAGSITPTHQSTYDRYTYYRLLSQMGVESVPESGRMNINYDNLDSFITVVAGNTVTNPPSATNFMTWQSLTFFTNATDRMLRYYTTEWRNSNPTNFATTFYAVTNFNFNADQWTNYPAFGLHGAPGVIPGIPVLMSNQFVYTPAVQRVLQLAANIYEATTENTAVLGTNYSYVFRPIFEHDNLGNVFITGYTNLNSPLGLNTIDPDPTYLHEYQLELPFDVADITNLSPSFTRITHVVNGDRHIVNVYGVPWIIGAKKGFPNFNEFAMESAFQLTRKLQVTRPNTNSPLSDYQYNQMFNLSLTNQFGVECWNSYTNDFLRPVAIYVFCTDTCLLTNDEGFSTNLAFLTGGFLSIGGPTDLQKVWPGYEPILNPLAPSSFQIPMNTSVATIPASMYRFNDPNHLTTNLDLPFETGVNLNNNLYPQPHWWLMTTNNLQVVILDKTHPDPLGPYYVIDYVQLRGPTSVRDLTSEIISQYDTMPGPDGNDLWNTNLQNGLPIGLTSQIGVSIGNYTAGAASGVWDTTDDTQRQNEIDGFRAFFPNFGPLYNNAGAQQTMAEASMTNAIQAPYTPTATVVQHFSWQANDPLVHYTADDLNWAGANQLNRTADDLMNEDLGKLNQRYMPWGGNPILPGADQNPYDLALKDPLVGQSDDWDFPTNKFPTVGWLGRVHRGTPWQTVYLKSPDILNRIQMIGAVTNYIGTNTWVTWAGDAQLASGQYYDAANTAPAQDRLLFDLFTTAFNDNATRGQLSVNVGASDPNNSQAGLAAWSALFSGVQVLSNNAVDAAISTNLIVQHAGSLTNFTAYPINPAGPGGARSALGQAVAGINQTRANFVNLDGLKGTFEHAGDVLSVPQLTDQSPFLNWNDAAQQVNGINDEMYEWLPQQAMSLLRVSGTPESPVRYVIYSYGQALKPAPKGIYTGSGQYFGMVTNYQVVAESATRTVVRYNGTRVGNIYETNSSPPIWVSVPSMTNNNAQIERFNVLPPN